MVKYYSEAPAEESMEHRWLMTKGTSYEVQNIATIWPLIKGHFQLSGYHFKLIFTSNYTIQSMRFEFLLF